MKNQINRLFGVTVQKSALELLDEKIHIVSYKDLGECLVFYVYFDKCVASINFYMNKEDKFGNFECNCLFGENCKHVAALCFLVMRDYGLEENKSSSIIEQFNSSVLKKLSNQNTVCYQLVPFFEFTSDVNIRFKIGELGGKKLFVKNTIELLNFFSEKSTHKYGIGCEVIHEIDLFENRKSVEKILSLIDSTQNSLKLAKASSSGWYSAKLVIDKKRLITSNENALELMHLQNELHVRNKKKDKKFKLDKNHIKTNLILEEYNQNIQLNLELSHFSVINNHAIFLENEVMHFFEFKKDVGELIKYLCKSDIQISKGDYPDFCAITIKELEEDFYIKTNVKLEIDYEELIVEIKMKKSVVNIICNFDKKGVDKKRAIILEEILSKYEIKGNYKIKDQKDIISFIQHDLELVYKYSDLVISNEDFKNLKIIDSPNFVSKVTNSKRGLKLELLTTEFDSAYIDKVISSALAGESIVNLDSGEIVTLDKETISQLKTLTVALNVSGKKFKGGKIQVENYRSIYLDRALTKSNFKYIKDNKTKILLKEFTEFNNREYDLPKLKNVELRQYQIDGIKWMLFLRKYQFGGILADDMGLGKTVQIIGLLEQNEGINSIVVAPSSLLLNWENEILKFSNKLKPIVYAGDKKTRSENLNMDHNLVITSYDILKRDIELFEKQNFEYVIIDEAQAIKNQGTQNARAVKVLNAKYRIALTGTPLENNILDMWSIFDFIMPGYLYTQSGFKSKFNQDNQKLLSALKEMINPFILRRIKKDVLKELPDKIEQNVHVELSKKERIIYDSFVHELKNLDERTNKLQVLALLTKMRQSCCNASLVEKSFSDNSSKTDALIELISDLKASEQKVLVFSQFTSNFNIIKKEFEKKGITYYSLTGSTKSSKRYEMVEMFNKDDTNVFLISLKAGGTGLNITGATAVIHFDPWWNVSAENQATDRAHRMGQKSVVNVYKIIAKNTIEDRILDLQKEKKELVDALLENNENNLKVMSKDDIMSLFK